MNRFDLRAPSVYVPLLFLLLVLAAPLLVPVAFFRSILVEAAIFALLGVGWNILGGYAGQLSLGHAAYFGMGGYTSALLLVYLGVPTVIGLVLGAIMAMLLSVVIGLASFRLRGPYFAIATIATAETLRLLALKFKDLTFGALGTTIPLTPNAPLNFLFADKLGLYYTTVALLLVALAVTAFVERSRLGYYLVAVGQDEDAAEAVGIKSPWVKQQANLLSALFSALAGTLYIQYVYFIQPDTVFGLAISVEAVLVAIVGGVGILWGPVLGALLLQPLASLTNAWLGATYAGAQLIVYAIILMIVILVRPDGLIGVLKPAYKQALSRLPGASIDRRRLAERAQEVPRVSPA
jgi:branched-chain amino acid transport system permease protein